MHPVGPGQHQVEQHQPGLLGLEDARHLPVVAGDQGGETRVRERVADMAQRLRVVVDHEDGRRFGLRAGPAGAAREGAGAGRLGYREREGEAGAEAEAAALGPDAPAVSLDQALADGKSQPAADLAVAVPGGDVFLTPTMPAVQFVR